MLHWLPEPGGKLQQAAPEGARKCVAPGAAACSSAASSCEVCEPSSGTGCSAGSCLGSWLMDSCTQFFHSCNSAATLVRGQWHELGPDAADTKGRQLGIEPEREGAFAGQNLPLAWPRPVADTHACSHQPWLRLQPLHRLLAGTCIARDSELIVQVYMLNGASQASHNTRHHVKAMRLRLR